MSDLARKKCVPCEDGDVPPFTPEQARDMMPHIPEWTLSEDGKVISREFPFKDFASALDFANRVGALAEEEWHHPELIVTWGRVKVLFTTHSIRGLAENDFIMAAKVDML